MHILSFNIINICYESDSSNYNLFVGSLQLEILYFFLSVLREKEGEWEREKKEKEREIEKGRYVDREISACQTSRWCLRMNNRAQYTPLRIGERWWRNIPKVYRQHRLMAVLNVFGGVSERSANRGTSNTHDRTSITPQSGITGLLRSAKSKRARTSERAGEGRS